MNDFSSLPASPILAADVKQAARDLGFDLVGIAAAGAPNTWSWLQDWIDRGYAGEMQYIPRRQEAYEHPRHVLEGVRSLVLLGLNYAPPPTKTPDSPSLRIARYAYGSGDYHDLIRKKLKEFSAWFRARSPQTRTRGVVDTAPLLERDFARLAGLGWFGKNTMLINRHWGSWFFLAALLTDLELDPDAAHLTDHCGTCTRCLEACPTNAFPKPYVLDARRCISYLTIELREQIPSELRPGMGDWLFGCDICQEVCPWNRKAPPTSEPTFFPQVHYTDLSPQDLLGLSAEQFDQQFGTTPLARSGRAGILRNAAIVLGNRRDPASLLELIRALNDSQPLVRGAVAWALGCFANEQAQAALRKQLAEETDPDVLAELELALRQNQSDDLLPE